ncbi:MAG: zinc-binding dehydrogenase [Acidobacteria bacterium]|nr:zinc-binding dehydrogenase [Acidobacteriota bacterium]NIM60713.1 zinc-binding dehydrogenase [Acidobacteriota bacterium]NIO59533.1 zinc-binding dehydrogenase [Acidobacteriota bacterium]NIQ85519.1 zinc-binding dehydrogenase [Acidobacteriota bacterium]NIT11240.1 zinc-binding dehydrogenase [Acidobacteriota bacterium]
MKRRAWKIEKAGRIDRLRLVEETLGSLKPDHVRVRVRAAGLNFADIFALTGLYSATPKGAFTPGLEFSGEVLEIGDEVSSSAIATGQRVMGCIRFGGYAEVVDVPASQLQPIPESWSFEQGAAFPAQTLTAWYALSTLGAVAPGQLVLVQSAAGGVGLQAMAICRALGAEPIGTVSGRHKKEFLAALGYEEVIVRSTDFAKQLDNLLSGRPLHLVLDAVGGKIQRQSYDALAPTGRMVVFGAAEYTPGKNRPRYLSSLWKYLRRPRYDPLAMIPENKSIMAFNLIWLWDDMTLFDRLMGEVAALELDPPHVGKPFPFDDAPAALEHLRSGQSIGKVVLTL